MAATIIANLQESCWCETCPYQKLHIETFLFITSYSFEHFSAINFTSVLTVMASSLHT
jgi:hypothetical protein